MAKRGPAGQSAGLLCITSQFLRFFENRLIVYTSVYNEVYNEIHASPGQANP